MSLHPKQWHCFWHACEWCVILFYLIVSLFFCFQVGQHQPGLTVAESLRRAGPIFAEGMLATFFPPVSGHHSSPRVDPLALRWFPFICDAFLNRVRRPILN
jgi:hypothetical protein